MDRQFAEVLINETTKEYNQQAQSSLQELGELQLALIGGGIGDTVL